MIFWLLDCCTNTVERGTLMPMQQQTWPKTEMALMPQYVRQFSCIGSECEDTCCQGWRVNIDEETYKKYQRVRDLELKPLLKQGIGRVRSNANAQNYGKIKMNSKGKCPFLSENKLCSIQLKLGADYLPDTCKFYPRVFNRVNGILEKSATMSCPEAARLALLNPNPMEFDEVEEYVVKRGVIYRALDTRKPTPANKAEKYFWELRIFTIQVLQNRREALADRLLFLGLFYQKIQQHLDEGKIDAIPETIGTYLRLMEQGGLAESLSMLPSRTSVQMTVLKKIADARFVSGISNGRYIQCYTQFLKGLKYTREATEEEIVRRYETAYRDYYEPFMREHEYILENYLVNYVFMHMFPFGKYGTVFSEYTMLVLHYALIKMHLIGMAAFHQGLTTELVIQLFYSFSRVVEHNSAYLQSVYHALKHNGYVTMPYMAVLIRN